MNKETKLKKIIQTGILPEDLSNLNEQQQEVLNLINNTKIKPSDIINEYIDLANIKTKQMVIYRKIMSKRNHAHYIKHGISFNIKPEDIVINEYCPYLNTKLSYKINTKNDISKFQASPDRFDNAKGYVKGNVMIISRLANTIKNEASISELKTFSLNIIKKYRKS